MLHQKTDTDFMQTAGIFCGIFMQQITCKLIQSPQKQDYFLLRACLPMCTSNYVHVFKEMFKDISIQQSTLMCI